MGLGQEKRAPGQVGSGQMGTRTNGSGLELGQGNNCPGPICPRIVETGLFLSSHEKTKRFIFLAFLLDVQH